MRIPGSTIEKCPHGIYLASPEERALNRARYCCFCCPDVYIRASPRQWKEALMAHPVLQRTYNKHACPRCGCETHSEEGKIWVCADCGNERERPHGVRKSTRAIVSIRTVQC